MIHVHNVAAVELMFLGPKIVFVEYGFAVLLGAAIGQPARWALAGALCMAGLA